VGEKPEVPETASGNELSGWVVKISRGVNFWEPGTRPGRCVRPGRHPRLVLFASFLLHAAIDLPSFLVFLLLVLIARGVPARLKPCSNFQKHASGAKALVISPRQIPGINPRPAPRKISSGGCFNARLAACSRSCRGRIPGLRHEPAREDFQQTAGRARFKFMKQGPGGCY